MLRVAPTFYLQRTRATHALHIKITNKLFLAFQQIKAVFMACSIISQQYFSYFYLTYRPTVTMAKNVYYHAAQIYHLIKGGNDFQQNVSSCLFKVLKVIQIMYISYQDCYNIMMPPMVLFVWQPSTTGIIWRLLFPHQVKLFLEGSFDGKKDFVVKIVHTLVLIAKKAGFWLVGDNYSRIGLALIWVHWVQRVWTPRLEQEYLDSSDER